MTMVDTSLLATDPVIAGLAAPDSAEAIIANARAILPLIAEEADGIEELGRLTPRAEAAMRAAGVFQMAFPARRGGVEMSLVQQVEVAAIIAAVDGSAGWHVGVLNATGYYATRLGDEAYAELYPTRDMPTAGAFHPRGRADKVPGGYMITGKWGWGSGSYTAEHIIGGAEIFENGEPVMGADGKQMHLGMWLPREAVEMMHDWQVLGVRGSGSTTYAVTEPTFVPEKYTFDREALDDPAADPLNKSVLISHVGLTGVLLGMARHAVELAADVVHQRTPVGAGAKVDSAIKQALGEAMCEVDFAYAGVREVCRMTDAVIFTPGAGLNEVQRARMTAASASAANALRRVLTLTMDVAASVYLLDRSPIQRVIRDGLSAIAHGGARRPHQGVLAVAALDHPDQGYTIADEPGWAEGAR